MQTIGVHLAHLVLLENLVLKGKSKNVSVLYKIRRMTSF